ncbi:MAG: hypothetical protein P4N59_22550 [Negativicutes bacterium]|nr:hypothetical protein [Negativicutes bacterium]
MPEQKSGADKFGLEHEIKTDKEKEQLSSKEVRTKALHYKDTPIH